jgi:hypothetical protein
LTTVAIPLGLEGFAFQWCNTLRTRHYTVCIRTDRVHSIFVAYFILMVNSHAMGFPLTNHGNGHIRINRLKIG